MKNNKPISVVIAAAGKGTRAGLKYPKCLFEVKGSPILIRIINALSPWSKIPNIIVSPSGKPMILNTLAKHNIENNCIVQPSPNGMGDAILKLKNHHNLNENILLVWGDLPFISQNSVVKLIKNYFLCKSDFSLITAFEDHPYTVVIRDSKNQIKEIIETRENENFICKTSNERDIGIFLFKKDLILDYLEKPLKNKYGKITQEHGFLYLVKHLSDDGYKISSIAASQRIESVSFNSINDMEGHI